MPTETKAEAEPVAPAVQYVSQPRPGVVCERVHVWLNMRVVNDIHTEINNNK